jgi:hypothetical protein
VEEEDVYLPLNPGQPAKPAQDFRFFNLQSLLKHKRERCFPEGCFLSAGF